MLSAIAARKARLNSSPQPGTPQVVEKSPTPPPTPSPPPSKIIPKRRPANGSQTQTPNPSRKKRKKDFLRVKRYFDTQDPPENEENVIVVDEDELLTGEEENCVKKHAVRRAEPPIILPSDSSDEGSDAGGEEEEPDVLGPVQTPRAVPDVQEISTFRPVLNENVFHVSNDEVSHLNTSKDTGILALLLLDPGQTLALLGTYAFTVVHGRISLSGVTLSPSPKSHRVFAPRSSPIPVLRALPRDAGVNAPQKAFLPRRFLPLSERDGAIVIVQENNSGVKGLGRVCKTFDGVFEPSRWQKSDSNSQVLLPDVQLLTHESRDIQPFVLPSSWEAVLSTVCLPHNDELTIAQPEIYLVKGPKKSGKSTFAVTLLNRLSTRYRRVAFLECDLGQSEFTPAGMVALNIIEQPVFGPPFTHPSIPNFAHYIGATTPRSSPSHYLNAIEALLQSYRLDVQTPAIDASGVDDLEDDRVADIIPLVVNTMGWNKGLGADLARKIEDIVQPTAVFEIEPSVVKSGQPTETAVATAPPPLENHASHHSKLYFLEPVLNSVLSANYSPADHRTISILSYFHAVFPTSIPQELQQVFARSWNTSLPLCAYPPYEVDWSLAVDRFVLTGAGMEDVVPQELRRVLNGAVVGLVSCVPGTLDMDVDAPGPASTSDQLIPYVQGSPPPSPSASMCSGLALIRAVSPTSTHMHVLTPLPPCYLKKSKVVVKGTLELPVWGMLDFMTEAEGGDAGTGEVPIGVAGVDKGRVPYLQWGKGEGLGAERRRVRRNLMRRGQM